MEKTHTQVVLDRSTLEMDILQTRGFVGVISLSLEPQSNPPACFFGTLRELQMEVAVYSKDKYTVCPSIEMVILVEDELSQQQWTALVTVLLSFGENVAMEILRQGYVT